MVPGFEKAIKGTVVFVVADNLGAHSVAGFVENFTGSYSCRFCLGNQSDIQSKEVRCGGFQRRTKEQHTQHVQTALSCPDHTPCYGVKKSCALSEKLDHFHVTSGYPPDVLHDILEGIVSVELALSIDVLIKKRYILSLNSTRPFVSSHTSGVIKRIARIQFLLILTNKDQWEAMPLKIGVWCVRFL